ncbi:hAT family C-terminal dimerization region [Phytophthora infestans]|uniref:HAT family C-terminal dimerization region n=1 Tax=Phytophthora infestans TaxID=4787 RepID=A0A8S9TVA2_PHYIN|nr:hAT family C-terminal dimerization region [Phytophthora infestans]
MILALVLHPAHKQAGKKHPDKTPLTLVGSLCRVVVYYFRRFNLGKDTSKLYEDLRKWIVDEEETLLSFADFSSIHSYWKCMRSEMPGSKLPDLAFGILSIAVNTATCERYFSELALIHIVKRNKMSSEKARKLALVRKKVREFDAECDASQSDKATRLIDPTERTRHRDRDDRFECCEPEEDAGVESVAGSDTAFEYWRSVLCELEGDNDPPVTREASAPDFAGFPQAADVASIAEEINFATVLKVIEVQSSAPNPDPDRRPFPNHNDRPFPQEKKLLVLRGQKATLVELSKTPDSPSTQPVWHFASPQPLRRQR